MGRPYALILGIVFAMHGLGGLFIEGTHFLAMFNVDIMIDLLYLAMAAALLAVGLREGTSSAPLRVVLIGVGGIMVLLALIGLSGDRTAFGLLPTGLTDFDIGAQITSGALAIVLALTPQTAAPLMTPENEGKVI
ncbi:hypothetical protein [Okibacterium endophyticum]